MGDALEFLARLEGRDADWVFAISDERSLEIGDCVLVHGKESQALFIVLEGKLAVFPFPGRKEYVATVAPGEILGEMSFLDSQPASASVAAIETSRVLAIPLKDLRARLEEDTAFAARLYRALGATVSMRKRREEAALASAATGQNGLLPTADESVKEKAARLAAGSIARLKGRMNHPCMTVQNRNDYLSVITSGLPRARRPRDIAIVGAGVAGLTAAYELWRAGNRPLILEASHRAGGRCYTLRAPFAEGQFGEAGAMRFPSLHKLLFAYLDQFGLKTRPFNSYNEDGAFYLGGTRTRMGDVMSDPSSAPNRVQALWKEAMSPLRARYFGTQEAGGNCWPSLVEDYNELTLRDFLVQSAWSEEDIKLCGAMGMGLGGLASLMNISFLEVFRLSLLGIDDDLREIIGGADRLPSALVHTPPPGRPHSLDRFIRYGARVNTIAQEEESVQVGFSTASGPAQVSADYALVTVPFPMMRFIQTKPPLSTGKQRAIRDLHYFSSTKVFLQCRTRFWEEGPQGERASGMTVTDLPIRSMYFPQGNDSHQEQRGVILASYTWEDEAKVWESLTPDERVKEALRQVGLIYPRVLDEFEVGASVTWNDPGLFTGGAFAFYAPGQMGVLYEDIVAPEGRVHFAGEHTSFEHGWLEGAIESGLREALALSRRIEQDAL